MENIHHLFIFIQFITALLIFFSNNPMHSILFMILLFFESALILALFNLDFFALLFIIIYVGAIAILFLFIVMLLDVKFANNQLFYYYILSLTFCFFFFLGTIDSFEPLFYKENSLNILYFEFLIDLYVIAQILYNYYLFCFLIAGLILFVALVGAIAISFDFNKVKNHGVVFRKLSRSSNFLSFFQ